MFMESMEKTLNDEFNYKTTENGGLVYRTTGKELVDFSFAVSSMRSASEEEIIDRFTRVYFENPELAVKFIFFARDVREGLGERRLFRTCFKALMGLAKVDYLIEYIPEYGRWDDVIDIYGIDKDYDKAIVELIEETLQNDLRLMLKYHPISLCAKWLPSINASNKERKAKAIRLAKDLKMNHKTYRQVLSRLRSYLNIVEAKMCNNQWGEINYEEVPSMANLKYRNAFLAHDEDRRVKYLNALSKGKVKINSSVTFPSDIVHKYSLLNFRYSPQTGRIDETLEAMWKSLPDLVENEENVLVMADGSGSMLSIVSGESRVFALEVATAIAIYFAEHSKGQFHDKYLTFSNHPQIVDFAYCKSLKDKIMCAYAHDECQNTNIEKAFDLILSTAVNNHMSQDDMPKTLLVISDMEFDAMTSGDASKRMFDEMSDRFKENGYELPKLVFWNICNRTNSIPLTENDRGVALVSGFSANIMKMVLSNKLNPYDVLVGQLLSERYKEISIKK